MRVVTDSVVQAARQSLVEKTTPKDSDIDAISGADPSYTKALIEAAKRAAASASYNLGELADASAAGMSASQIEEQLKKRGVNTSNSAVQQDIKWALSK